MNRAYLVDARQLPRKEYVKLLQDLDDWTALAQDNIGRTQIIEVFLRHNQTLESLKSLFPVLNECKIMIAPPKSR